MKSNVDQDQDQGNDYLIGSPSDSQWSEQDRTQKNKTQQYNLHYSNGSVGLFSSPKDTKPKAKEPTQEHLDNYKIYGKIINSAKFVHYLKNAWTEVYGESKKERTVSVNSDNSDNSEPSDTLPPSFWKKLSAFLWNRYAAIEKILSLVALPVKFCTELLICAICNTLNYLRDKVWPQSKEYKGFSKFLRGAGYYLLYGLNFLFRIPLIALQLILSPKMSYRRANKLDWRLGLLSALVSGLAYAALIVFGSSVLISVFIPVGVAATVAGSLPMLGSLVLSGLSVVGAGITYGFGVVTALVGSLVGSLVVGKALAISMVTFSAVITLGLLGKINEWIDNKRDNIDLNPPGGNGIDNNNYNNNFTYQQLRPHSYIASLTESSKSRNTVVNALWKQVPQSGKIDNTTTLLETKQQVITHKPYQSMILSKNAIQDDEEENDIIPPIDNNTDNNITKHSLSTEPDENLYNENNHNDIDQNQQDNPGLNLSQR